MSSDLLIVASGAIAILLAFVWPRGIRGGPVCFAWSVVPVGGFAAFDLHYDSANDQGIGS
jgi:hypothetical protein